MTKKKRVKDRFFSEECPSNNLDFVEVQIGDIEGLDRYLNKSPSTQRALGEYFVTEESIATRDRQQKRQKRLLRKVLQAASSVLTERQFQIFILRFMFNLTEEEVADRLTRQHIGRPRLDKTTKRQVTVKKLSQPYVTQVLQRSIEKIQKELRLATVTEVDTSKQVHTDDDFVEDLEE